MDTTSLSQFAEQLQALQQRFESHAHTQYDGTKKVRTADLEDSSAPVVTPGTSRVRATLSGDYYPGATAAEIAWTEEYDGLSEFDGQSFTATTAGYYLVQLQGTMYVPSGGAIGRFYIKKNNVTYLTSETVNTSGSNLTIPVSVNDVMHLAGGDLVNFWIYSTSGSLFVEGGTAALTIHQLSS